MSTALQRLVLHHAAAMRSNSAHLVRWQLYKPAQRAPEAFASVTLCAMNLVHPKKLLLSKWTAVRPVAREKHFLVVTVILPETPDGKVEWVELEAVHSKAVRRLGWRELRDDTQWRQGWV